jgi:hypothetical protein
MGLMGTFLVSQETGTDLPARLRHIGSFLIFVLDSRQFAPRMRALMHSNYQNWFVRTAPLALPPARARGESGDVSN